VGRVTELCARLGQQRIVGKKLQSTANGVVKVLDVTDFGVVVGVRFVVANSGKMRKQQAG
jgi:hypothetical protein